MASAVVGVERSQRRSLEAIVTHCIPRDKCLLYVDFATYDETPLVVQLRGEQSGLSMAPAAPVLQEARQGGQLASFAHVPELRVSTNAAPQKILQHVHRGGMLVEVNARLLIICISTLSNLTVIERGTAETLKECQLRLSGATRASATFRQRIRLVCTDGCAANILCEKHVAAARGDACSAVHALCDVHRASLVPGKTFSLLDENVRGMLRCALSLRDGTALSRFRRCLKDEIASRLQTIPGRPPVDSVA